MTDQSPRANVRYRLSWLIPMRFHTEFTNHKGHVWRAWWWQWRDRPFRLGGYNVTEGRAYK